MEQHDLIAKTAQRTGVPERTAADVLEAAKTIQTEESHAGQPPPTASVEGEGAAQRAAVGEPAETIEQAASSNASAQAARKRALEKAEAAFGRRYESDSSKRTYSERSGLLI